MILLDTSFLIDYFKGVEETSKIVSGRECVTTVITYHEIMAGVRRLKVEEKKSSSGDYALY
jgi:predicted nucleic acid-binding protein